MKELRTDVAITSLARVIIIFIAVVALVAICNTSRRCTKPIKKPAPLVVLEGSFEFEYAGCQVKTNKITIKGR